MKLPEYIKKEEVAGVCKELKIRDWTKLKEAKVQPKEAKTLLALAKIALAKAEIAQVK